MDILVKSEREISVSDRKAKFEAISFDSATAWNNIAGNVRLSSFGKINFHLIHKHSKEEEVRR